MKKTKQNKKSCLLVVIKEKPVGEVCSASLWGIAWWEMRPVLSLQAWPPLLSTVPAFPIGSCMPACLHVCIHWNNTRSWIGMPHQSHVEMNMLILCRQTDCMQARHTHAACTSTTGGKACIHITSASWGFVCNHCSAWQYHALYNDLAESQGATSCCMKALLCHFISSDRTLNSRLSLVCGSTMLTIGAISILDVVVQ